MGNEATATCLARLFVADFPGVLFRRASGPPGGGLRCCEQRVAAGGV